MINQNTKPIARNIGYVTLLIILAVVVLAVVGGVAWRLIANRERSSSTAKTAQNATQKVNPPSDMSQKSIDKYAGWKLYCSEAGGICFKYPSDWVEAESNSLVTVTNPSKTVQIAYRPSVQGVGGQCDPSYCKFTTDSITPLGADGNNTFQVIKGVFESTDTGSVLGYYFLASNDRMSQYNLKPNQTVGVGFFGDYFSSPVNDSVLEEMRVKSLPDNGFSSVADANAWLANADAVVTGDILSSSYAK